MDIAFIGRLTKVNYILHNAPTSRVRNPGPDLGQAQQRLLFLLKQIIHNVPFSTHEITH
jgi:hypothetical protein